MRQPTNLRGATLPGLSQSSEKEGPHHRSFWLPRLQRQADSLSFCLAVEGPKHLRLWKATKRCFPLRMTAQPLTLRSDEPGVTTGLQGSFFIFYVCDCRVGSVGLAKSLIQCVSWLLPSQKPDIWTALAIWAHAAGWVTSITASRWPMEQTWTWKVTDPRLKFHWFTIRSFHSELSSGCGCWKWE